MSEMSGVAGRRKDCRDTGRGENAVGREEKF